MNDPDFLVGVAEVEQSLSEASAYPVRRLEEYPVKPSEVPASPPKVIWKPKLWIPNATAKQVIIRQQEWLARKIDRGEKCVKCGRDHNLTVDHILPDFLIESFGYEPMRHWDEENLVVMCKICNNLKGHKLDFSLPQTKPLLIKYIQKV